MLIIGTTIFFVHIVVFHMFMFVVSYLLYFLSHSGAVCVTGLVVVVQTH